MWKVANLDVQKYVYLQRMSILQYLEYIDISRFVTEQAQTNAKKK